MNFGIYDPHGKCWLGNDNGPLRFTNLDQARLAAAIMSERLGRRVRPDWFPKKPKRIKGVTRPRFSAVEALRRLRRRGLRRQRKAPILTVVPIPPQTFAE